MGIRGGIDESFPKIKELECPIHGVTKFGRYKAGNSKSGKQTFRYRCKPCGIEAVKRKRKNLKLEAIKYKGSKCIKCGYNKCIEALDFHHRDATTKEFGIAGNGNTIAWNRLKVELDKCDLLCSNCHRETHAEIYSTVS